MRQLLEWFPCNPWIVWPVAALIVVFALQIWFYGHPFSGIQRMAVKRRKGRLPVSDVRPPVSVIVCAHDQAKDLEKHLPALLEQDYPDYQVVVVNAASTDHTADVLQSYESNPRLYHTFMPPGVKAVSPRKMAMTLGLKAARHPYVLFTDPSAKPSGPNWLTAMMQQCTGEGAVVLGYAPFQYTPGLTGRLVAYDNLCSAIRYMGFALMGLPYRAHPANMAFRKDLFFTNKGFASHLLLRSGDDDLLIREIATPKNVRVEVSPDSLVTLETTAVWSTWKEQLINHFTTASHYKPGVRSLLLLEGTSRTLFYLLSLYVLIVAGCATQWSWMVVAALLFLVRWAVQAMVMSKAAKLLAEPMPVLLIPLHDALLPLVKAVIRISSRSGRGQAYTWEVLR